MASSLAWTDDTGSVTLTNSRPTPADRFAAWKHWRPPIGPVEVAAGTGQSYHWPYREEHLASFELRHIPMASLALLERLKYHLETGGEVTVTVGDPAAHIYVCIIAPGTMVEYDQADPQLLLYTLQLSLKNTAALPLLCSW
jgi:hypothetical protein